MAEGRRPDYRLAALNKATEETSNVGAAWMHDKGRISIKLNAFVKLESSKDLILTLFPEKESPRRPAPEQSDDDKPF